MTKEQLKIFEVDVKLNDWEYIPCSAFSHNCRGTLTDRVFTFTGGLFVRACQKHVRELEESSSLPKGRDWGSQFLGGWEEVKFSGPEEEV